MKTRKVIGALLCSLCLAVTNAAPVMADAMRVVTLGADLTDAQKNTMLRYFKVNSSEVQILTITNQDEREHLSAYVPIEQIGSRTVSCAYVKPTQSGGIKVRTANLNWVTCNMIASTLSTSGVTNCEVVAACPFEVSGTGALTGIIMAYETASGEKLDETKKELATQELVVTGNLAEDVGQADATNIINQAKIEIIGNNIQDADQIQNIVVNIAEQNNMSIDAETLNTIVALLQEIAQQNYNYNEMRETLENVEDYLNSQEEEKEPEDQQEEEASLPDDELISVDGEEPDDGDSIVDDLDESILGDNVIAGSTEDPTLEEETRPQEQDEEQWDYEETFEPAESEVPEVSGEVVNDEAMQAEPAPEAPAEEIYSEVPEAPADESYSEVPEASGEEIYGEVPEANGGEIYSEVPEAPADESYSEVPEASGEEIYGEVPETSGEEIYSEMPEANGEEIYGGTPEGNGEIAPEQMPEGELIPQAEGDGAEEVLNTDTLPEESKALFEKAQTFCLGEYEGNAESLLAAAGEGAAASVVLDAETGAKLSKEVQKAYLEVLSDGGLSYVPADTDMYLSPELNMMDSAMKKLFGVTVDETVSEDILANVPAEDKLTLYNDTMNFFASLYNENTYSGDGSDESYTEDTSAEDMPVEEEVYQE